MTTIPLATTTGIFRVDAEIHGEFAVHQGIGAQDHLVAVTHLRTGLVVKYVCCNASALALINELRRFDWSFDAPEAAATLDDACAVVWGWECPTHAPEMAAMVELWPN